MNNPIDMASLAQWLQVVVAVLIPIISWLLWANSSALKAIRESLKEAEKKAEKTSQSMRLEIDRIEEKGEERRAKLVGGTIRVVPFRGEYYELKPHARHLCRNLIYPVPNPALPFLGVHFTRMVDGRVECGPSAVLAFAREGYHFGDVNLRELWETLTFPGMVRLAARHWKTGLSEILQSLSTQYYLRALRHLIPEIEADDLMPSPSGVRAQAVSPEGELLDDFLIQETDRVVNVLNAASPAATASLNVGRLVGERLARRF